MAQEYILKWNNFNSVLANGCKSFLETEDLADVTLTADGQSVRAHKLILSIFSPYFRRIFKDTQLQHHVVILKDVEFGDLNSILQFMYKGEVCVSTANINSLIGTAILLGVDGLTMESGRTLLQAEQEEATIKEEKVDVSDSTGPEEHFATSSMKRSPAQDIFPTKRISKKRKNDLQDLPMDDHFDKVGCSSINNPLDSESPGPNEARKRSSGESTSQNKELVKMKCPHCSSMFVNRYNLKVHIRDMHNSSEVSPICDICHKQMRNISCLRMHIFNHKKQAQKKDEAKVPKSEPDEGNTNASNQ